MTKVDRVGVHMTHCNQGEYVGSCKYGDAACPALVTTPGHKTTCEIPVDRNGEVVFCGKKAHYHFSGWDLCYNHAAKESLHYMVKERIVIDDRIIDERRHYPTIPGGYGNE